MNILLLGSGGREHALGWALAASPGITRLFAAPGNPGLARLAECVALDLADHMGLIRFCRAERIEFVVIGPEAPLVAGLADELEAAGIMAFGPSKSAARLEGSKSFTKDLCIRHGIATAGYRRFTDLAAARAFVETLNPPIVIKADGLAAGKGVTIAASIEQAAAALEASFGGAFGEAGATVIVEEFLEGEEASFFALADGETALPLATAQDHKCAFDGDTGPNTGGMGAYSPAPVMTPALCRQVMDEIITPTIQAMKAEGAPFRGVLYAGLMITASGPKLIEYNVRFGDPECQVLMLRLKSDLLPALLATRTRSLKNIALQWRDETALTVVMAAKGYPGDYAKGTLISGLEEAAAVPGVKIFHAGTRMQGSQLVAHGGRVLDVCATGDTVEQARARAYLAVSKIDWPDGFYRTDIGWRCLTV